MAKKVDIEATTDSSIIKKADIVMVCVPTPVDKEYMPDLTPIKSAASSLAEHLKKDQLIIFESTVNPGVCQEVVLPILEKSGLKAGQDFYLAHCPERIDPGNKKWNVRNIPRVVGAYAKEGLEKAVKFYQSILEGQVRPMKSLKEAEATKIVENTFRDINIAFVNELARSFDKLGIDVYDVIQGASTKPFAFMAHYPSIGVGGHCIPVDPYYLIKRAKSAGFDHKFLKLAREINKSMPGYAVNQLMLALNQINKSIKGTKIGLLGISYKANVSDKRETPFSDIQKLIKELDADLLIYDPYFKKESNVKNLDELIEKSEVLVVVTNHNEFVNVDLNKLKDNNIKIIIDGKNCLNKEKIEEMGIIYKGMGR